MIYLIKYENGASRSIENCRYEDAVSYAENNNGGWDYEIVEIEDWSVIE